MNNKIIIILGCLLSLTACGKKSSNTDEANALIAPTIADSISEALDYQISHYPSSQYRDVYKNFMQDFFGPGHILADTAASGRYLRQELAEEGPFEGPLYEKTGFRGNFYRVNLSLIKEGVIPYDTFFPVFVESVQGITPPSGGEWMKTWNLIDSVIMAKGLHFPDENIDRQALADQFAEGNFIAHHSGRFNESVHFHYRIISRDNFEKIILPLIEKSK
ncbi:MAG: hypothetical protein K2K75_14730 [Muribaculaceae bacterium]|nr:hypothetical protein [Muribaculaceae bacterium]